jgi:hypothetical protein
MYNPALVGILLVLAIGALGLYLLRRRARKTVELEAEAQK